MRNFRFTLRGWKPMPFHIFQMAFRLFRMGTCLLIRKSDTRSLIKRELSAQ